MFLFLVCRFKSCYEVSSLLTLNFLSTQKRKKKLFLHSLQIWLKPSAEMQFLYGNHVLKGGLGRITEATPAYSGVVVLNMADVPLGFGVAAKSTADCRRLDPSGIVAFHQSDVGEYLRKEDDGL